MPSLPERVLAIDLAFADIPHAFGGALALAYHAEPRATRDIDVNVFVPYSAASEALGPLALLGADVAGAEGRAERDGQVRVMWDTTPIDLFFSYDPFHDAADSGAITVDFAGERIRVLSATHLTVCKAVFDRPKDWVDIDAMRAADASIDVTEVVRWVGRICGDRDRRFDRVVAVFTT